MQLLVGDGRSRETVALVEKHHWGRMLNAGLVTPYLGEPLGFDNEQYNNFTKHKEFDAKRFLRRIDKARKLTSHIIVAVVPDIVGGGKASLALSDSCIDFLAEYWAVPWFLSVQEGMTLEEVKNSLQNHPYAGIFLGGATDSFKNHMANKYSKLAHSLGLKFHYGRCGTPKKIRKALAVQADSCDSAFPIYWKPRVKTVVDELAFQLNNSRTVPLIVPNKPAKSDQK
jgi:hypothetical protein